MFQWANNDWKNSSGKIAENVDIVKEYYELYKKECTFAQEIIN